jgi:shikimate kinase
MTVITLVGPRGVGKSTVGKELAVFLNYKFIKIDDVMDRYLLEKEGGLSEYAKKYGWAAFMKELHKGVKKVLKKYKDDKIVLEGGYGSICSEFPESKLIARLLKKNTQIVLLIPNKDDEKSISMLFEREREREFWKGWNKEKLRKKVRQDYLERINGMKVAVHYVVYVKKKSPKKIAREIEELLNKVTQTI